MRTRWKMARERKKKDIPEEKRKYLRHLVHFFCFFSGKKGKNHPFLDRDRDASFFLCCLSCFDFGGKKSTDE